MACYNDRLGVVWVDMDSERKPRERAFGVPGALRSVCVAVMNRSRRSLVGLLAVSRYTDATLVPEGVVSSRDQGSIQASDSLLLRTAADQFTG